MERLSVERAADGKSTSIEHVRINHCRFDIFMPEQFLNRANVVAILKQVCGKGMAKGVAAHSFVDFGGSGGFFDRFLQSAFAHIPAARDCGLVISCQLR